MDWHEAGLTPLAGGYSGETFLAPGDADPLVVRIYRRNPDRAGVDAALLRLVAGLVPVPNVVEVRLAVDSNPGVLVTEQLAGLPLDQLLREDPGSVDTDSLGGGLGRILATLSGVPFRQAGEFAGPGLGVADGSLPDDLLDFARHYRDTGRLASWSEPDWGGLAELIDQTAELLDAARGSRRTVLVHSDFNPKNILVDPHTLAVTGLVDWEFAYAGAMYTDLGNLLRFERDPAFELAVMEGFVHFAPGTVEEPLDQARGLDLWALIELAGRPVSNAVTELATKLLLAQARSGDLHAWPWPASRVDPAHA